MISCAVRALRHMRLRCAGSLLAGLAACMRGHQLQGGAAQLVPARLPLGHSGTVLRAAGRASSGLNAIMR